MLLNLTQIIIAISLTALILLQSKGGGLGSTFGGSSQTYHSKKGVEKVVFTFTIILSTAFVIISVINFIV